MWSRLQVQNAAIRVLACTAVAVTVAGTAFICAWYEYRSWPYFLFDHRYTGAELDSLTVLLDEHRAAVGRYPDTLAGLRVKEARVDDADRVVDIWRNPYVYRVDADGYTLYSLGRDGRGGGDGIDADVYPTAAGRPQAVATFWQFATELETAGVKFVCAMAGVAAFIMCQVLGVGRPSGSSRKAQVLKGTATAVAAVLAAVVISFLHLPTGH
jgi:hypothetical protein